MGFSSICLQALAASASLSEDDVQKAAILRRIVEKYTPIRQGASCRRLWRQVPPSPK